MFDLAISEIVLASIVALVALGPKEMVEILKQARKLKNSLIGWYESANAYMHEALEEESKVIDIFIDKNGKHHKMYDLDDIKPPLTKDQ